MKFALPHDKAFHSGVFHFSIARACLKKAFCKMCVTICGRFCPDEGAVAGYGNRIRAKYTAKWGVQIAGMIFQTGSNSAASSQQCFQTTANIFCNYPCFRFSNSILIFETNRSNATSFFPLLITISALERVGST